MGAGGTLRIAIVGDSGNLTGALDGAADKVGAVSKSFITAGTVIAAALTGAAVGSGKAFADFDEQLTNSMSIMGDVSSTMKNDIANAAMKVAESTKFSADQAAESFYFLASAGLDANQAIGAMPAVAAFATAGNFDLSKATDLLMDSQSALGLSSKDAATNTKNLARVSDVLTKASILSNASIEQLSEALTKDGAGALKAYNKSVEEGVAVLSVFASQGIKGSEAGTLLKNTLTGLDAMGRKNTDVFAKFGVTIYDTQGNMRNTADIIGDMEKGLGGLSVEAKNAALQQMGFNDDQRRGIIMLLGSSAAIREYQKGLEGAAGATKEVATKQMQTFNAQFGVAKSIVHDVAIVLGSFFMPAVTAVLTKVNEFGSHARESLSKFRQELEATVGGAEGMKSIGSVFNGLMLMITGRSKDMGISFSTFMDQMIQKVVDLIPQMGGTAIKLFTALAEAAPKILPQLVSNFLALITRLISAILQAIPAIVEAGVTLVQGLIDGIAQALPELLTFVQQMLPKLVSTLMAALPKILESGIKLVLSIVDGIVQAIPVLVGLIATLVPQLAQMLITAIPQLLDAGVRIVLALIDGLVQALPQLLESVLMLVPQIVTVLSEALPQILDAGVKILLALINGIIQVVPQLLDVIVTKVIPAVVDSVSQNLPKIIESGIQILTSLITGLAQALPKLVDAVVRMIPLIVQLITDNLPKIINAGVDIIIAVVQGLLRAQPQLTAAMVQCVWALIKAIPGLLWAFVQGGADLVSGIIRGIGSMAGHLASKLVGIVKSAWNSALDFLGIHSPSRKGIEAGKFLMIGFQQGLDSVGLAMPALPALMSDVDQTVSRSFKEGGFDFSVPSTSWSPPSAAQGRGSTAPNVSVHLEGGLDNLVSAIRVKVDEDAGGSAETFFNRR